MASFFQNTNIAVVWLYIVTLFLLRYLIIAGLAYAIIWKWKFAKFQKRQIQSTLPESRHLRRDFLYSLLTMVIFATVGAIISRASRNGYTLIYYDLTTMGIPYFIASIVIMLLVHDAFFYWAHRFMHIPRVYQKVHRVHHLSKNPSPWSAFAFHPYEAFLEAMILPIIVFSIPVHLVAIIIFLIIMTFMNVIGHLGFELYPKGFVTHVLGKWNNTSTHHNMHHELVTGNYGLYFNWWDRWMKTNHPDYIQTFNNIKNRIN